MGRVGSALDNAMAESFVCHALKAEMPDRLFPSREAARTVVFEYIEGFYDPTRRHSSSIGYVSPADYERAKFVEEVRVA